MFPHELTFGVFDAAASHRALPDACVWVREVIEKPDGREHLRLIDGGTRLESIDDTRNRYFMRSATTFPRTTASQVGDIVRLLNYRIQRTSQGEPAIVITKMEFVRRTDEPQNLPAPLPYPHQSAQGELARLEEESRNAAYRRKDQQPQQQQQQQQTGYSTCSSERQSGNPYSTGSVNEMERTGDSRASDANVPSTNLYPPLPTQLPMRIQQNAYAAPQAFSNNPYDNKNNAFNNVNQRQQAPSNLHQNVQSYGPTRKGSFDPSNAAGPQSVPQRAAPYPPEYRSSGPVAHRVDGQFVPIKALTAFLGRWISKGRFVNVTDPRPYTNQRGEGKIWNMDLMDSWEDRGIIRCTMFNKAIDRFQSIIRENEIYTVSKGTIKPANKKFNSGAHDFEIQLGEDSDIQWVAADDPTIPLKHVPQIVPINQLTALVKNTSVSVCGILLKCTDIVEITARSTGRPRDKRDITIVDESGTCVDVTLWGNKAQLLEQQNVDPSTMPVLVIEDVRVDEYNGRKLSSVGQTSIAVNPPTPAAHQLRHWFDNEGRQKLGSFNSLTAPGWSDQKGEASRLTIAQIKHRATTVVPESELEDKGAWFSCRATLVRINRDKQFFWVACPTCGKKVNYPNQPNDGYSIEESSNAVAHCVTCHVDVSQPVHKFMLMMDIADSTGSLHCVALGDKGQQVMGGVSADSLVSLSKGDVQQGQNSKRFSDFFNDRQGRMYLFKILAKMERYRDEATIKYRLFGLDPISGDETDMMVSTTPDNTNSNQTPQATTKPATVHMRQQIIKDAKTSLEFIYEHIPRITTAR